MGNGIKLNEKLYSFTTRCVKCAQCTLGYRNIEFEVVCPIYQRHKFFTYSLGGMPSWPGRCTRGGWG